jgi:hypothetical protein
MTVAVSNIKRLPSKKLLALFSLELPSGVIINSCLLHYSKDRRCFAVLPPQIPLLKPDGAMVKDARGEVVFEADMSFRKGKTREHFEATALAALRIAAPDLFERQHRQ